MNGISSNTALIIIYVSLLVVGLIFVLEAIVSLLRSFSPGRQSHPEGATGPVISRAWVYSLGLSVAVFGATGLFLLLVFDLQQATSVLVALGFGLIVGLLALALLVYLPSREQIRESLIDFDATGHRADVVIAIPANGLGEVTFRHGEERVNLGARSANGLPIVKGESVVIERVTKRVAVVSTLDESAPPTRP